MIRMRSSPASSLGIECRRWWRIVALLPLLSLLIACGGPGYAFSGSEIAPAQDAPPLDLIDQSGQRFSWEDYEGKAVVLYFGYTTCPDACPTTLSDYLTVKELLGDRSDDVAFVMASIDPERDTPERLAEYLRFFDPTFVGLTGAPDEVAAAARGYGVTYERVEYPESATRYLMDHSTLSYVIDPQGRLRLTYPLGADPAEMAEDLRHLF